MDFLFEKENLKLSVFDEKEDKFENDWLVLNDGYKLLNSKYLLDSEYELVEED